jgi:hypothetical protein
MNSATIRARCLRVYQKVKIQNHAREESALHHAQHEPDDVETQLAGHEHLSGRDHAPYRDDRPQPEPRSDLLENHIRGDFKQEVSDEEHSRSQAIDRIAEAQVLLHLQLGEAHVDPVDVSQDVADEQERHQTARHFGIGGALKLGGDVHGCLLADLL